MLYTLISDIHANWTALNAVEQSARELQVCKNPDYWFLGDLVGYGPCAQGLSCVKWLRERGDMEKRWVAGNHDEWIVSPIGNFRPRATLSLLMQQCILLQDEYKEDWKWFKNLVRENIQKMELGEPNSSQLLFGLEPNSLRIEYYDRKGKKQDKPKRPALALAFVHASIKTYERRITYLFPWSKTLLETDLNLLPTYISAETTCLIHGHTHYPVLGHLENNGISFQKIKYGEPIKLGPGAYAINPGSVGQPRDGDARASYAMLNTADRSITFYRVPYSNERVIRTLKKESNQALELLWQLKKKFEQNNLEEAELFGGIVNEIIQCWENHSCLEESRSKESRLSRETFKNVHASLENMIRTADGGEHLRQYNSHVYQVREWGLDPLG